MRGDAGPPLRFWRNIMLKKLKKLYIQKVKTNRNFQNLPFFEIINVVTGYLVSFIILTTGTDPYQGNIWLASFVVTPISIFLIWIVFWPFIISISYLLRPKKY